MKGEMHFQYLIMAISSYLSIVTSEESHKAINTANTKSQEEDRAKIIFLSSPQILIEDTRKPSFVNQNRDVCQGRGQYLNICGECVGGNSEKEEDYGMDSCGICHGLDRCLHAECFEDFEGENEVFEDTNNCSSGVLRLSTTVVDMAASERASVILTGGAEDLTWNDTECGLLNDSRRIDVRKIPGRLGLSFDFNGQEEKLELRCNTSGGHHLSATLFVVNSKRLLPLSSDKFSIPYGTKNKLTLKVSNLFALVDLMCFAKFNGTIIYKYWTNDIQGNSLMSQVTCDELWLESTNQFQIGVAYSESAVAFANTIDIAVQVDALMILEVQWDSDDVITIHFNQNINEIDECEKILKGNSVNRFSHCETAANRMRLKCKLGACVENQIIELTASVDLLTARKSFAFKLPAYKPINSRKSTVEGPNFACTGSVITFSINDEEALATGGSDGTIQWSLSTRAADRGVNVSDENVDGTTKGGTVTAGNQQRRNLILWHGLRELRRVLKSSEGGDQPDNFVALNSSLLQPDIPYQLMASFNTSLGRRVTLVKTFTVLGNDSTPIVVIHGPRQVAYNQMALFEADLTSCGSVSDLKYTWKLGNNETLKMANGTKVFISGSQLAKSFNKVTLYVASNGVNLAQSSFETKVKNAKYYQILLEELILGTGQSFTLEDYSFYGTQQQSSNVTYKLSCQSEAGRCIAPGKTHNALEMVGDYASVPMNIAKGSLAVGRYTFTLTSKLPSGEMRWNNVKVNVIPGEPPLFKLVSYSLEPEFNIIVDVLDVFNDCEIHAKSLKRTNFTFYEIRKTSSALTLTGTPNQPESTRIKINVPTNQIKHGTNCTFQVVANCGSGIQSWIMFSVPVPEKSAVCQLKVSPNSGIALKTKFKFTLQNCPLPDAVIRYGYVYNGSVTFLSTSMKQHVELYGFPGEIIPIAKICESDKSCSFSYGNRLSVDSQNVENSDLMDVVRLYKNNINSLLYEDAAGVVQLMVNSLANQLNGSFNDVIDILKERITEMTMLIQRNSSVTNLALDLLQSSTNISRIIGATNGILPQIVDFRDKIYTYISEKSASLKRKREPLITSGSSHNFEKDPRPRRSPGSVGEEAQLSPSIIKTMLTTFAYVILNHQDPVKVREEKEKFLNRINEYIVDMCNGVGRGDGVLAGSSIAQLSAVRVGQSKIRQEISVPICSGKCSNATGQVSLGRQVIKNNEGVCIGTSYMPYDFYSDIQNGSVNPNLSRQSGIYSTKIFNYNGNDVTDEVVLKKPSTVFRLPLWKETNFSSESSKCFAWIEGKGWSSDTCKTVKLVLSNGVHFAECRCPVPGIFGIFSPVLSETVFANETTTGDKERLSSTSNSESDREHPKVTATFMINEDFNDTVGNKQDEFGENIKKQLIDKVNLPEQANVEANNYQDSIKVLLKLKYWDQSNLPTIVLDLADILDKGELKLLGLDQKELNVPRQKLELTLVNKKKPSSLVATLSSIVFLGLTIVVVMIFASVLVKWRRRQRALNFLQVAASSDPKYLKLHDSASIEQVIRQSSGEHFRSNDVGDGIVLSVYQQRNSSSNE